jgi:hypothetical protein
MWCFGAIQWFRAVCLRAMISLKEMNPTVSEFVSIFTVDD